MVRINATTRYLSRGNINPSVSKFCLEEEVWNCLKNAYFRILVIFFCTIAFGGMLILYCRPLTTSNCAIHGGNLAHLPQLMNHPAQFKEKHDLLSHFTSLSHFTPFYGTKKYDTKICPRTMEQTSANPHGEPSLDTGCQSQSYGLVDCYHHREMSNSKTRPTFHLLLSLHLVKPASPGARSP